MQIDIRSRLEAQALLAMRWGPFHEKHHWMKATDPLNGNHRDKDGNRVTRVGLEYEIRATDPMPSGMRAGDHLIGEVIAPMAHSLMACLPVLLARRRFDNTKFGWEDEGQ